MSARNSHQGKAERREQRALKTNPFPPPPTIFMSRTRRREFFVILSRMLLG